MYILYEKKEKRELIKLINKKLFEYRRDDSKQLLTLNNCG